jgi:CheY-like chemotaxis protein
MRILIVDDSTVIRLMLKNQLKQLGVKEVDEAPNGQEALHQLREHPPDLVFLDLHMPVLDGLGFLKALGGEEKPPAVPIVIVSSVADVDQRAEALRLGARSGLTKPFKPDELKAAISEACPTFSIQDARPGPTEG